MVSTLSFTVNRSEPLLVGPAKPMPGETKLLSDLDNTESPSSYMGAILVYRAAGQPERGDPVGVIRQALSEALVHYYPLAGRIREGPNGGGLLVDCTGEGVLFAEAEADVRLAELEAAGLGLPFPCNMDELHLSMDGVLDYPMLLMQVTRLVCGGFIVGVRLSHSICDGQGFAQFLTAIADLAKGLPAPAISPAWSRELLTTMSPNCRLQILRSAGAGAGAGAAQAQDPFADDDDMVVRTFLFGQADIAALKRNLSTQRSATTYQVLAAAVWRARNTAIRAACREPPEGEGTALTLVVSFRRNAALQLPPGYYGNTCAPVRVVASTDALARSSLDMVVELVHKAKEAACSHVRSVADVLLLHGPPPLPRAKMFLVSDIRHLGIHRVDFGWGEPLYAGPAQVMPWETFLVHVGEEELALSVALPRPAMERFAAEMTKLLEA